LIASGTQNESPVDYSTRYFAPLINLPGKQIDLGRRTRLMAIGPAERKAFFRFEAESIVRR
jgi:hypothetical protein